MTITVHHTNATAAAIADIRPVGVEAPAPVRPSATSLARAALTRSRSTTPALRRRPLVTPRASQADRPQPTMADASDTVVVTVVRPPRHGAGGGARARPATTSV